MNSLINENIFKLYSFLQKYSISSDNNTVLTISSYKEAINVDEIEKLARLLLPIKTYIFYMSGGSDGITLQWNRDIFQYIKLLPKILIDVTKIDTSTYVFGQKIPIPLCIAPFSMQKMAHPNGELETAGAAKELNTIFILSTNSNTKLEEIPSDMCKWMQLYILKDREKSLNLLKKAEQSGFTGVVLTVDCTISSIRDKDMQVGFKIPKGIELVNIEGFKKGKDNTNNSSQMMEFFNKNMDSVFIIVNYSQSTGLF